MKPLLEVNNLTKTYMTPAGFFGRPKPGVQAVDDVSFQIRQNATMAIVGESGCGKSTIAKCIIRLENPTQGEILFDGVDLAALPAEEMRLKRRDIQMIYQDPYASLNPRMTVFSLLAEPLRAHKLAAKDEIQPRVEEMAAMIGLAKNQLDRYPHQFSGGQRQRISIGRALMMRPKLILADEPVSALDVSIQAQVLNLLADLQEELGLTMLFISHDLNVVQHVSDHIAVMYLGRIMEEGATANIFKRPRHPYTVALMESVPQLDPDKKRTHAVLEGDVLSVSQRPAGCPFATRCPKAQPRCHEEVPPKVPVGNNHDAYCFYI